MILSHLHFCFSLSFAKHTHTLFHTPSKAPPHTATAGPSLPGIFQECQSQHGVTLLDHHATNTSSHTHTNAQTHNPQSAHIPKRLSGSCQC